MFCAARSAAGFGGALRDMIPLDVRDYSRTYWTCGVSAVRCPDLKLDLGLIPDNKMWLCSLESRILGSPSLTTSLAGVIDR